MATQFVGSMVEWLKRRNCDRHGLGSKPSRAFCCVLGKDTSQHFPLIGVLGIQL